MLEGGGRAAFENRNDEVAFFPSHFFFIRFERYFTPVGAASKIARGPEKMKQHLSSGGTEQTRRDRNFDRTPPFFSMSLRQGK